MSVEGGGGGATLPNAQSGRERLRAHDPVTVLAVDDQNYFRGVMREVIESTDGFKLVAEATYRRGTSYSESFRPQAEILRAANPDVVISVGTYSACAGLIRDARDAAWDVPIANVSGVDSENLLRLLIDTGRTRGKDYTRNIINSQVVPSYSDTSLPAVREYRELMDRFRPMPPRDLLDEDYTPPRYSFISLEGYLNARLMVEILRRMGTELKRERIKDVVESIQDLDLGIDARVSFGPGKHQGLDKVYYTVVTDGRFVTLEDWKAWRK